MRLNSLRPAKGSKQVRRRPGRGIGSGLGKTGGRGHKGQTSRAGGYHKVGFEGGQMPLQRRLPKIGFVSRRAKRTEEVRLTELSKVVGDVVTLEALRSAGVIGQQVTRAKVIASGKVSKAVTLQGVAVTKGARAAIEAAGGRIEE
ncbi:MAG: large subunit ribosomal protein L15 [Gammaproteobacteria bacterium]|nr:MAG: large subunit ribosomal protein L15 [Gammaproteobacteria bacterium]TND06600.1 MAG: large subunit ribosomal protein L15 [Gammaproteobacteria bacterium]